METVLAAQGDTWGIPGQTFLALFAGAAGVLVIAALIHRAVLFAGHHTPVDRLGPQQVAYLNGRDKLAVYSSLAGLRGAGAIEVAPGRTLTASGPMPAGATPLDQAVYNAASQRVRARDVADDQWVKMALDSLRDDLERRGLAPSQGTRVAARTVPMTMLALLAVGLVRLVAGISGGKPVGFLIALLLVWALVTLVFFRTIPSRTRAARRALDQLRRQHSYLAPSMGPAWATYGAAGLALGVGLYGAASLWQADAAFAEEAEIQRQYASTAGSGGYYGDSGGSDSGGSDSGGGDGGGGGCGGGCGGCGG
ncbi:TIGR04222 domain-containing membrane protein [Phytohabitans suffuscus]|nr:TIGR04222 domain-containing membrane protein [Phytohabitans suffuscus]